MQGEIKVEPRVKNRSTPLAPPPVRVKTEPASAGNEVPVPPKAYKRKRSSASSEVIAKKQSATEPAVQKKSGQGQKLSVRGRGGVEQPQPASSSQPVAAAAGSRSPLTRKTASTNKVRSNFLIILLVLSC